MCDSMINSYSSKKAYESRHDKKKVKSNVAQSCDVSKDLGKYAQMIKRQLELSSDNRVSFPKKDIGKLAEDVMEDSNDRLPRADKCLEMNTGLCTDFCGKQNALCPVEEDTVCFIKPASEKKCR